jgi:hypothetical protein
MNRTMPDHPDHACKACASKPSEDVPHSPVTKEEIDAAWRKAQEANIETADKKKWFNRLWRSKQPPKPTRTVPCFFCKKPLTTDIMEGEVVHLVCQAEHNSQVEEAAKAKAQKEEADRHMIELIKTALREYDAERRQSEVL